MTAIKLIWPVLSSATTSYASSVSSHESPTDNSRDVAAAAAAKQMLNECPARRYYRVYCTPPSNCKKESNARRYAPHTMRRSGCYVGGPRTVLCLEDQVDISHDDRRTMNRDGHWCQPDTRAIYRPPAALNTLEMTFSI